MKGHGTSSVSPCQPKDNVSRRHRYLSPIQRRTCPQILLKKSIHLLSLFLGVTSRFPRRCVHTSSPCGQRRCDVERIRRTLPIAVLAGMSIAVGLPFILASRETPSSSLPITSWGALISVTSRSLVIPMVSALIAAVLAAAIVLFGYGVCARSIRRILFALSAIPFLFPPVIVAHAVHQWLGEPNLLFSSRPGRGARAPV